MAGCVATINYLADLVDSDLLTRRERILGSMQELENYEERLFNIMEHEIQSLTGVTTYGHALVRTPTIYFNIAGFEAADVYRHLSTLKVNAPAGNFYALEVSRALGLGDTGAVRAGLAPYSTLDDVSRLVEGLRSLKA
jgi:selenocysteine lyase/cysteine desulfurase